MKRKAHLRVITRPSAMQQQALAWKRAGLRVALVPTMGALHAGHLSLVARARRLADVVVMSIYVNPTQFGPKEDFTRYPRPFARDRQLAAEAGVDVLFHPRTLYYPDDSTVVEERELARGRCGAWRPGHFTGVATVVAKLFLIVQPDVAVFGQKDAQQCDVIERMVRDLWMPVRVVRAPIVRDARGLALSSRNSYLSAEDYERALALPQALKAAAQRQDPAEAVREAKRRLARAPGVEVEYVECVGGRLCAAVRVGSTRLIDNVPLAAARKRRGTTGKNAR
jgi:pantoate--beta-alanine ligase